MICTSMGTASSPGDAADAITSRQRLCDVWSQRWIPSKSSRELRLELSWRARRRNSSYLPGWLAVLSAIALSCFGKATIPGNRLAQGSRTKRAGKASSQYCLRSVPRQPGVKSWSLCSCCHPGHSNSKADFVPVCAWSFPSSRSIKRCKCEPSSVVSCTVCSLIQKQKAATRPRRVRGVVRNKKVTG